MNTNHNIPADHAILNCTWKNGNGELKDPIFKDLTDSDIKMLASEAIRSGDVPGITPDSDVDFTNFVIDRFDATPQSPLNKIFLRAKTPFGS